MEKGLAKGQIYEVIHVESTPAKCKPLIYRHKNTSTQNVSGKRGLHGPRSDASDREHQHKHAQTHSNRIQRQRKREQDVLIEHLVVVVSPTKLILYGMHVLVYESPQCFTVFVSKADTTGYVDDKQRINVLEITKAAVKSILSAIENPSSKPVRISLFAKAHPHYLFNGSTQNPNKHVLSDAQLVRWWISALDKVAPESFDPSTLRAKIQIPGADRFQLNKLTQNMGLTWTHGNVFSPESNSKPKAVYTIPRFPDDPKTRFLDDLVLRRRTKKTPTDQFWIEMESRQEFRLGSVVAILGLEGTLAAHEPHKHAARVTPKLMKLLYQSLIDGNYDTVAAVREATAGFMERVPSAAITKVEGQYEYSEKPKSVTAQPVNVLSVRSKKSKS